MTNPNKAKGSGAERAVVETLRATGWPYAERRLAGSSKDRGDIAGVPGVVIEVKNCARQDLAGWIDEARLEQANDHADLSVVWHKRRGRANPADWFVTMDGATFTRLLAVAGYGSGTAGHYEPSAEAPRRRPILSTVEPDAPPVAFGQDSSPCAGCGCDRQWHAQESGRCSGDFLYCRCAGFAPPVARFGGERALRDPVDVVALPDGLVA